MPENCFSLGLSVLPARVLLSLPRGSLPPPIDFIENLWVLMPVHLIFPCFYEVNAAIVFPCPGMSSMLDERVVFAISWGTLQGGNIASRRRLMQPFQGPQHATE